jgi:hypothetical protein
LKPFYDDEIGKWCGFVDENENENESELVFVFFLGVNVNCDAMGR